jgi:hypothetical protein
MRRETGATVISTLTRGLDRTLAEPHEICPKNPSPCRNSLLPYFSKCPLLYLDAYRSTHCITGAHYEKVQRSWREIQENVDQQILEILSMTCEEYDTIHVGES